MAKKTDKELPFWQNAERWQSLAIAGAVITAVLGVFALFWVLQAPSDHHILRRVQIVGAGLAFGLASVTFFTVVWRGLISQKQADLQRLQVEKLAEQIVAAKESNLAELLQRGAELLSQIDKPAHVAAGIATLKFVALSPTKLFSVEAMELIADFLDANTAGYESNAYYIAVSALNECGKYDREIGKSLLFEAPDTTDFTWSNVIYGGVRWTQYDGGSVSGNLISYMQEDRRYRRNPIFRGVQILGGWVKVYKFYNCTFRGCEISECYGTGYDSTSNIFVECNFSGCVFKDQIPSMERSEKNYYYVDRPPISDLDFDWSSIMEPREKSARVAE